MLDKFTNGMHQCVRMGEISDIICSIVITFLIWQESNSQKWDKRRREKLGFVCRKGNTGEYMLFSLRISKLTKRNNRIVALGEGMLYGKYSMFKDQVRLAHCFATIYWGIYIVYMLLFIFKHIHFESTIGRRIMESSLPPFVWGILLNDYWQLNTEPRRNP